MTYLTKESKEYFDLQNQTIKEVIRCFIEQEIIIRDNSKEFLIVIKDILNSYYEEKQEGRE